MNVKLTTAQARKVRLDKDPVFVRAAFYTGHALNQIAELASEQVYAEEREAIKRLAFALGMTEDDIVEVANAVSQDQVSRRQG